ncbi:hypothetical protein EIO_2302 [Ketogulonicigenium vulgare Y25]|uniref:Uncharacterized protein n=1 Tax=Ketogulonicigenium vulgare (strain WSH-001) TaxID=759362 RepID=F9Y3Y9_KETVW|nr:hypothetical protein EIO_2302 [Ketogulonicigenium vulgare Y25]AEM41680.1 hypothetical protein KVU_1841 [Ketogulonicigenium vulgare WSH-001]ALJ81788.1 hypothetical protein KVH_11830 [Ketogulonicigenium vulgare]ANW35177.1 hypothetical protein KvSKV_11745 [Ketogulonicigenium vulgare]AOZ55431.1 hypothetical protein KVC_2429 [Ketogulonicigenium vulgare]
MPSERPARAGRDNEKRPRERVARGAVTFADGPPPTAHRSRNR